MNGNSKNRTLASQVPGVVLTLFLFFIPAAGSTSAQNDWIRLHPQISERISSVILMNNGGMAAGVQGDGLLVRRPGGQWAATSPDHFPGIQFSHVAAVDPIPGLVLATTSVGDSIGNGWLYRSIDYGETWDQIDPAPLAPVDAYYRIGYSRANPMRIYMGAFEDIWASNDAGVTWTSIHPVFPDRIIFTDVAVHPADADSILAGARGDYPGIFQSLDGGQSWSRVHSEIHVTAIEWDPLDPNLVIATGSTAGFKNRVVRSMDGGLTWTVQVQTAITGPVEFVGLPGTAVARGVTAPDQNGALYATLNGGLTWFLVKEFTGSSLTSFDAKVVFGRLALCAAIDRYGVYFSLDQAATWSYAGPSRGRVVEVEADPYRPGRWFAGTDDSISVFMAGQGHRLLSDDGGRSWQELGDEYPACGQVTCALFSPTDPLEIHTGSDYVAGCLSYTLDGGITWDKYAESMPRPHCVVRSPANAEILFMGHDRSLSYPTIDCGLWSRDPAWTWTKLWQPPHPVQELAFDAAVSTTLFAALGETDLYAEPVPGGALFKSLDAGITWSEVAFFSGKHVAWVRVVPGRTGHFWAGTLFGGGVFKTEDGGLNWKDMSAALHFKEARDVVFLETQPGWCFAATDAGVLESGDFGATWQVRNNGLLLTGTGNDLLSLDTHSIAADEQTGRLIVGTTAGIFGTTF